MKAHSLIILLFVAVMVSHCSKDKTTPVTPQKLQGNYTGRAVSNGIETTAIIGNVSVQISGSNYQSAFTGTSFPSGSSRGSFTINNDDVIFVDSLAHTANFNWGFLLSGTYSTQFKGDSLILIKGDKNYSYTYRLKKL